MRLQYAEKSKENTPKCAHRMDFFIPVHSYVCGFYDISTASDFLSVLNRLEWLRPGAAYRPEQFPLHIYRYNVSKGTSEHAVFCSCVRHPECDCGYCDGLAESLYQKNGGTGHKNNAFRPQYDSSNYHGSAVYVYFYGRHRPDE